MTDTNNYSRSSPSAAMPLHNMSPQRVNKQPFAVLPQSPSLPNITTHDLQSSGFLADSEYSRQNKLKRRDIFAIPSSPTRRDENPPSSDSKFDWSPPKLRLDSKIRLDSDVQTIVARIESLEIADAKDERRLKDAAALKRAQAARDDAEMELKRAKEEAKIAKEETDSEMKKVKEEGRALKRDLEETKERERRVMKRLDVVMEDLHHSKKTRSDEQAAHHKEFQRARKDTWKVSSMLVKLQEELKSARASLNVLHADLDLEKLKSGKKEQEAFDAKYSLVGVEEELAKMQERVKVVEEERDSLKTSLKEEEVARMAADGQIALPRSNDEEDAFASPKKKPILRSQSPEKRGQSPEKDTSRLRIDLDQLRAEIAEHKRQREWAEEQVHYMKLECQFGCCSCRIAERQGHSFVHDAEVEAEMTYPDSAAAGFSEQGDMMIVDEASPVEHPSFAAPFPRRSVTPQSAISRQQSPVANFKADPVEENDVVFSPNSGTFRSAADGWGQEAAPLIANMDDLAKNEPRSVPSAAQSIKSAVDDFPPATSPDESDDLETLDLQLQNLPVYSRPESRASPRASSKERIVEQGRQPPKKPSADSTPQSRTSPRPQSAQEIQEQEQEQEPHTDSHTAVIDFGRATKSPEPVVIRVPSALRGRRQSRRITPQPSPEEPLLLRESPEAISKGSEETEQKQLQVPVAKPDLKTPVTIYRTITTTTKIPLVDESTSPDYSAFTPVGITKEEAIEQLRQRRGRARSIVGTPKKIATQTFTPRRDISAPEKRVKATPRSMSRGRLASH